ncbi:scavenger receptor cysteine-rich domain-containing group B protein-like [Styela clava]
MSSYYVYILLYLFMFFQSGVMNLSENSFLAECVYYKLGCPVSVSCQVLARPGDYYCCKTGTCCGFSECRNTDINCNGVVCDDYNTCCRDISYGGCCANLEGQVRLSDGRVPQEVEIYHSGIWGTICDDGWDENDAEVVCRMLEFPGVISAPLYALYGKGTGPTWLSEVDCSGAENGLSGCPHNAWGVHHCGHNEDASVKCLPNVRLADGQLNKGRVEIFHAGAWGTIWDFSWDLEDARVVCRTLEFPGVISALKNAYYGEGTGQIWLNNVNCDGNEDSLDQCPHNSWGSNSCSHGDDAAVECLSTDKWGEQRLEDCNHGSWGSHHCTHAEDASAHCLPTVRLVNSGVAHKGRVEIFHDGLWGTICGYYYWDINNAKVFCKMLGFPDVISAPTSSFYGPGTGKIWLYAVQCTGYEATLEDCYNNGWGDVSSCNHGYDASVERISTVRIVSGNGINEGRVEIYHGEIWGTICDDGWDIKDAEVVCRMMGFPEAKSAPVRAYYGKGVGQIWLSSVSCSGDEQRLENCNHGSWGSHHCSHDEDASVHCLPTDIKPGNFWILGIELGIMLILLLIPMCMYRGSLQKLLMDIVETTCDEDDNRVNLIPAQPRQLTRASTASEMNIDHVYYIQPSREPVASSAPPVTNNTQEISEDRLCVICLSEEKNVFFGPCGHVSCYNDCRMRSDVTDCPVCRKKIEQRQRTFL